MGCYSFANHVLAHHPGTPLGFEIPSVLDALRGELPGATIDAHAAVAMSRTTIASDIPAAVAAAAAADVAVVVVGDRAGLFGRGTVGEGNDVDDLELPGIQRQLVEAVVATGTPVVLVVISGRPYAIGWALDGASRAGGGRPGVLPRRGGRHRDRIRPLRSDHAVWPSARLAPPVRGCAAVLVPASDPRRSVGDHERRQHSGTPLRAWPDVHDVRARRPAGRPHHVRRRLVLGDRAGSQHRRTGGRRSRPAVRARRLRERHPSRRACWSRISASHSNPARRPW